MLVFPNAKINLGLHITEKRKDGYHNLETCFYPVMWQDALEIIESEQFVFTSSGLAISGAEENNLCVKAYNLLKTKFYLPPVHIHLHKIIPMGAGLGGGSSDAAFLLSTLVKKFDLNIETIELQSLASSLGADCAFFLENKPLLAFEKGDVFKPISLSLKDYKICIVHPSIHVGTAEAYSGVKPKQPESNLEDILNQDITNWKDSLVNDFEASIFIQHPELLEIKLEFYKKGALYASMSGSGSAIFAIFKNEIEINFPTHFTVYWGVLP